MRTQTIKLLIARNVIYHYILPEPSPYRKRGVLNWRYRVPGETYEEMATVDRQQLTETIDREYQQPQAINWRWQPQHN